MRGLVLAVAVFLLAACASQQTSLADGRPYDTLSSAIRAAFDQTLPPMEPASDRSAAAECLTESVVRDIPAGDRAVMLAAFNRGEADHIAEAAFKQWSPIDVHGNVNKDAWARVRANAARICPGVYEQIAALS